MSSIIKGSDNFNSKDPLLTNTRQGAMNKNPVAQAVQAAAGMSSTIYTGNAVSNDVTTGIDMGTGDFGGLVWLKSRSLANNHRLMDTVRGDFALNSNTTNADGSIAGLFTFGASGFNINNSHNDWNGNGATYVAWSWQTNKKTSGLTNRNKAFTAHYNTDLGFSIVGYEGDGVAGHEIPHQLGVEPELVLTKNRNNTDSWGVQGKYIGDPEVGNYMHLNLTGGLEGPLASLEAVITAESTAIGTWAGVNGNGNNHIQYNFASVEGVSKIGKYTGTGAAGNYVDCGFKAGWILIKNLTQISDWVLIDGQRGGNILEPNTPNIEDASATSSFVDNGFVTSSGGLSLNIDGDEYLFMAFAESSSDATKTLTNYEEPTTPDTLAIVADTLISYGVGNETVGAGVTFTLGAGYESKKLWLYKDQDGAYGVTENRPLEGITRNDADKYGVVSPLDEALRTTNVHSGYESASGVASADDEVPTSEGWRAFDDATTHTKWLAVSTPAILQYKQIEKRVLKSWRFKSADLTTRDPRRFTIEGSNDGLSWTAIDSTYTASDYVGNGAYLWGDLHNVSGNATAYTYHRINVTAQNGAGDGNVGIEAFEFNTVLPSDYYLVDSQKMFNDAGTEIDRSYLTEIMTDAQGDVSWFRNLPVAKVKANDVEVHGELTYQGSPIIESGENSNGSYIKWADGTMICTWSIDSDIAIQSAYGSMFVSGLINWTYPVPFIEEPVLLPSGRSTSTGDPVFAGTDQNISNTAADFHLIAVVSVASGRFRATAIGRWK